MLFAFFCRVVRCVWRDRDDRNDEFLEVLQILLQAEQRRHAVAASISVVEDLYHRSLASNLGRSLQLPLDIEQLKLGSRFPE